MPKSADVADFADKLNLLTKRLNWSRSRLAQAVGVDKSLVARWAKGASRPTENSLMQLTAAAAKLIDGFSAADWDLAPADFAKRMGLDAASVATPAPATKAGDSGLADLAFPIVLRDFTLNFERYAGVYTGFYRRYMHSLQNDRSVGVNALRIWPEAGTLCYETHSHNGPVRGICLAELDSLMFLGQSMVGGGIVYGVVNGTMASHPRLLTGVFARSLGLPERAVGASMVALEFIERLPEQPEAVQRRWQELVSENRQAEQDDDAGEGMPREIADFLDVRVNHQRSNRDGERLYLARAAKL